MGNWLALGDDENQFEAIEGLLNRKRRRTDRSKDPDRSIFGVIDMPTRGNGGNLWFDPFRPPQAEAQQVAPPPDFLAQFATNLPSPVQVPMPDRANYMRPYDVAQWTAQDTYNQSVPHIGGIFDDLQAALNQREQESAAQANTLVQQGNQEQAALQQSAAAATAPTTLAAALGGSSQADAMAEADQALLQAGQSNRNQLVREMEAQTVNDSNQREADAEVMRSASLGNARTNLDAILQQIGIGRAGAEQQFQQDTTAANTANQQARNEHALMQLDMQRQQIEMAQQAEQMWAQQNERYAANSMTSGRMNWENNLESRQRQAPDVTSAMIDLIDEFGDGPTGRAQAMQFISQYEPLITSGRLFIDKEEGVVRRTRGDERPHWNAPINVDILRNWLREYYDEEERVDPMRYSQLGGDPTYLPVRLNYAG